MQGHQEELCQVMGPKLDKQKDTNLQHNRAVRMTRAPTAHTDLHCALEMQLAKADHSSLGYEIRYFLYFW